MLTLVFGLVLRILYRYLIIWRERCLAVGWGFVHYRMATSLSTKIQMVLVLGFASTHSLANIVDNIDDIAQTVAVRTDRT